MDWIARLNRRACRVGLAEGGAVEVLHWAYSPELPDNVRHRHAYFEACLVGGWGTGRFFVEDTPYALQPGTLFLARPGVLHRIESTSTPGMELAWVSFAVERAGEGLLRRFVESEVFRASPAPSVSALWWALRTVAAQDDADVETDGLTAALLTAIARACGGGQPDESPQPPPTEPAGRAIRFIHEHLAQRELSVAQVADAVAVSPRHLTRLLLARTGVTPAAYITLARMDRARTLLTRTDEPLKQIALLVGYPDIHHFTRAFTRCFGCPPGRFRETGGAASQRALVANRQNEGALV